ncbi:MAG: hypothetical protein Q8K78_09970 [Planctomycetaceae bacterium]|nr:hypothetical protein [Planctomycetaceae bacterium]
MMSFSSRWMRVTGVIVVVVVGEGAAAAVAAVVAVVVAVVAAVVAVAAVAPPAAASGPSKDRRCFPVSSPSATGLANSTSHRERS